MNIFGRVFGGLLVLISLGWLASIAGIRPGGPESNQIGSKQQAGTTDLNAPKQTGATSTDGKTPASTPKPGTRVGTSTFTTEQANTGQAATGKPEVEPNPRGVNNGTPAVGQNSPTTETAPVATPTPQAAPVQAGW